MQARRDHGFTLTELVIVVAIIAVLLLIALVSYASATRAAEGALCRHNQQTLEEAGRVNACRPDGSPFTALADLEPYVNDFETTSRCPFDDSQYLFDVATCDVKCMNHP